MKTKSILSIVVLVVLMGTTGCSNDWGVAPQEFGHIEAWNSGSNTLEINIAGPMVSGNSTRPPSGWMEIRVGGGIITDVYEQGRYLVGSRVKNGGNSWVAEVWVDGNGSYWICDFTDAGVYAYEPN